MNIGLNREGKKRIALAEIVYIFNRKFGLRTCDAKQNVFSIEILVSNSHFEIRDLALTTIILIYSFWMVAKL